MKFLKVHIQNFQKHSDLKLDFSNNLNVITGLTDSGKSGIFRALEWVCNFSNISESDYRKEGTKQTSVKIWLDNGFQIERIRSNSLNRYTLSQKDAEDKVFDSFGKETPEEIATVLGISSIDIENEHINLNFANQDQLNFLLDSTYSDTFKAKLFNKLTGNEVLDKVFKELNKESLRFKREIKETEENLEKQEDQLSEYSQKYKTLKKKLNLVKNEFQNILEQIEIYEHLKDLNEKLKSNKEKQDEIQNKASKIKVISEQKLKALKEQAEKFKQIEKIALELEAINNDIEVVQKKKKDVKVIKFDAKKLIHKTETLQELEQLNKQLSDKIKHLQTIALNKKVIKDKLLKNQQELDKIWKEHKICPLCGQEKK